MTETEVARFWDDGFLSVPQLIDDAELQRLRDALSDHLVVIRVAADQHPEPHHDIRPGLGRQPRRCHRHLVRTRYASHGKILLLHARCPEASQHAGEQSVGEFLVVARRDHCDAESGAGDDRATTHGLGRPP